MFYRNYAEIRPTLLLGERPRDPRHVVGVADAVLDLRTWLDDEPRVYARHGIAYRRLPLEDGSLPAGGQAELDAAADWALAEMAAGKRLLVHCDAGVSRGAFLAAYLLVRGEGLDADAALAALRARRPKVQPHRNYVRTLRRTAARLSEQNG